jgi:hypothetical protein
MSMENCRHCNAKLTPGMDWCPQCYTRTGPPQPNLPQAAPLGAPAQATGTATPTPLLPTSTPLLPREMSPEMLIQKYSRTKGGETSFGWFGRTMLSVGVFILGVIAYFLIAGNIGFEPGWKSFEMYLPVFFTVGGGLLWAVWRPARVDSRHR